MPALAFVTGLLGLAMATFGVISVLWFNTPVRAEPSEPVSQEVSQEVRWICTFSGAGQQASCVLPKSAS